MTTEAFVTMIWNQLKVENGIETPLSTKLSDYGYRRGWLSDQDVIAWEKNIQRRTIARIVHEILRIERGEKDEKNWQGAKYLKDLYDCHTCVNHVAQVYVKGIMESLDGGEIFGMRETISCKEGEEIVLRMFSKQNRIPKAGTDQSKGAVKLSFEEAVKRLSEENNTCVIDVRTREEYEENHLQDAKWIPMADIVKAPYCINEENGTILYFYCQKGYQSEIAAKCVAEAGYEHVYYFGMK